MITIVQTETYRKWFNGLSDRKAKIVIDSRLLRIENGLLGDIKSLGGNLYEIRIHYGAGYRLYFIKKGNTYILLLCGGDKSTQNKDIKLARKLAEEVKL